MISKRIKIVNDIRLFGKANLGKPLIFAHN